MPGTRNLPPPRRSSPISTVYAGKDVIVLGDFNDELLRSITKSKPSLSIH